MRPRTRRKRNLKIPFSARGTRAGTICGKIGPNEILGINHGSDSLGLRVRRTYGCSVVAGSAPSTRGSRDERHLFAAAGANVWVPVYKGNKCVDRAQMSELSSPWGAGGSMTWPLAKLLMYGAHSDISVDLPIGRVQGICSRGSNAAMFTDDMCEVGSNEIVIDNSVLEEE